MTASVVDARPRFARWATVSAAGVGVLNALAQALLVVGDPVPDAGGTFILLVAASVVAVVVATWVMTGLICLPVMVGPAAGAAADSAGRPTANATTAAAAAAAADSGPTTVASTGVGRGAAGRRGIGHPLAPRLLVSSLVFVVVVVICGVLTPALVLAPTVVAVFVLPAIAMAPKGRASSRAFAPATAATNATAAAATATTTGGGALRLVGRAIRTSPVRTVLVVVGVLLLLLLGAVVSLVLGFFITGWLAAGVTWLWYALCGILLLHGGRAIIRRAW